MAKLYKHIQRCCPDLQSSQDGAMQGAHFKEDWTRMRAQEQQLRDDVLRILYPADKEKVEDGQAAEKMNLPVKRVSLLAKMARKHFPLHADSGPIEILYEDEDIIVVNKPAGITTTPSHRFKGNSVLNRLVGKLGWAPLTVHRLDMETTGVNILAKTSEAARHLHAQFRDKNIEKTYLAITLGSPPSSFEVDVPIERHATNKYMRRVDTGGLPALTSFLVIASGVIDSGACEWSEYSDYNGSPIPCTTSLVQCTPVTVVVKQLM
ncbi:hypothetical protein ACKKBF_B33295 [Auxenochlorella protothecoides x Auxenochlorella symbiontica]